MKGGTFCVAWCWDGCGFGVVENLGCGSWLGCGWYIEFASEGVCLNCPTTDELPALSVGVPTSKIVLSGA